MGIQNLYNDDFFYFYDIKKIKGDFASKLTLSEDKHIASLEYTAKYIDSFLSEEMSGDFSALKSIAKKVRILS